MASGSIQGITVSPEQEIAPEQLLSISNRILRKFRFCKGLRLSGKTVSEKAKAMYTNASPLFLLKVTKKS